MSGPIPSPCVQICILDAQGQICLGCGRHIDEISQWSNLTPEDRQAILARLKDPARPDKAKINPPAEPLSH